jgi:tryptophan halogenase
LQRLFFGVNKRKMSNTVSKNVIVGGGSAGWLTAGLLASQLSGDTNAPVEITLVESPDVKTIGVGEGTWPTMRTTLQKIGITEAEFLTRCSASFKQGTKFVAWSSGHEDEYYYHPFSAPAGYGELNLAPYWQDEKDRVSFVDAVCVQGHLCDRKLAPKQLATPEYAFVANYGYHLDAGQLAGLLQEHATSRLGVRHIRDHVTKINGSPDADIRSLSTASGMDIEGDLFVDCTGLRSLLLGEHYGVPFISRVDSLFNDRALAVQVPYADADAPIASQTISTARSAGWIWDIGLQSRRGVGYTYSSAHTDDEAAFQTLGQYVAATGEAEIDALEPRKIKFEPGHRERLWHRNCIGIGMSAGFLEPLEASALVMIELAAQFIVEECPADRSSMALVSKRYNKLFRYRWDQVVDFLKLHYLLSQRCDSEYWTDNRKQETIPDSLSERLELWQHRAPWQNDFPYQEEIFSAASYQYVLYGMGFDTRVRKNARHLTNLDAAKRLFVQNNQAANRIISGLPDNRDLLNNICRQA